MLKRATMFRRRYKNLRRYRQIVGILLKYGFNEFVEAIRLLRFIPFHSRISATLRGKGEASRLANLSRWERVRLALEDLGPAFVKLGQFCSNRDDILPKELCAELEKLLDTVPPFNGAEAVRIVETELGKPIDELFTRFEPEPAHSASIAQVHRAELPDGAKVAVKIQRPDITLQVSSDLDIISHIAALAERFINELRPLRPTAMVAEFRRVMTAELDFSNELNNIERFRKNFTGERRIHIPAVFRRHSSPRVLTMELIEGVKLADIISSSNIDPRRTKLVANRLSDLVLRQVFEHRFFHADPHAGNIIIMPGEVVCLIDFGMVGVLSPKHKECLGDIVMGLVTNDYERITEALLALSEGADHHDSDKLERDVFKLVERHAYLPLEDINVGQCFNEILSLVVEHRLRIPTDLYLLLKSLIALEGNVKKLNPEFDMVGHLEPFVRKLVYDKFNPARMLSRAYRFGVKYSKFFGNLPTLVMDLADKLRRNEITVRFEHHGLEPMLRKHDQISNRISYAIVTAAMLVASALILHAKIPPLTGGVSFIGLGTFLFALVMGSVLLLSILRHGRM